MNSYDARVRYTRKVIEDSFLNLLQQKHMSKITVTELCETAQINRATFYKHYADVPQLLEKLEENLFDQIRAAFSAKEVKMESFLLEMLHCTYQERNRFFALGGGNGDPNLMTKTFMVCYENAYPLLSRNIPGVQESERQMLYHFLSHGAGGILTWWIRDGMRLPPEDVAQFILGVCSITADGIQNIDWRTKYKE